VKLEENEPCSADIKVYRNHYADLSKPGEMLFPGTMVRYDLLIVLNRVYASAVDMRDLEQPSAIRGHYGNLVVECCPPVRVNVVALPEKINEGLNLYPGTFDSEHENWKDICTLVHRTMEVMDQ